MNNLSNLTRDQKVDLAFAAFATGSTIVALLTPIGPVLLGTRVLTTLGANVLGSEVTKAALNWLNKKAEAPNGVN